MPGFARSVSVLTIKIGGMFCYFGSFLCDTVTEGPDNDYDHSSIDVDSMLFPEDGNRKFFETLENPQHLTIPEG
jgi:hypothetical protein